MQKLTYLSIPFLGTKSPENMFADQFYLTTGIGHKQNNIGGVVTTRLRD